MINLKQKRFSLILEQFQPFFRFLLLKNLKNTNSIRTFGLRIDYTLLQITCRVICFPMISSALFSINPTLIFQ